MNDKLMNKFNAMFSPSNGESPKRQAMKEGMFKNGKLRSRDGGSGSPDQPNSKFKVQKGAT